MQLFALDKNGELIFARDAHKQSNYRCLECEGIIRLRAGSLRRAHFYHLSPPKSCQLHAKSMEHIQTQRYLQDILPKGDVALEHPFKPVGRIADVVWFSKKLIFEVQCSPISVEEVRQRNADYKKCGYRVIWLLHHKRYDRKRATNVEQYLWDKPFYYCNFDENGKGVCYDRVLLIQYNQTLYKGTKLKVNLDAVGPVEGEWKKAPLFFEMRMKSRDLYFEGDLHDLMRGKKRWLLNQVKQIEGLLKKKRKRWRISYRDFFQWLLEMAC